MISHHNIRNMKNKNLIGKLKLSKEAITSFSKLESSFFKGGKPLCSYDAGQERATCKADARSRAGENNCDTNGCNL